MNSNQNKAKYIQTKFELPWLNRRIYGMTFFYLKGRRPDFNTGFCEVRMSATADMPNVRVAHVE